MRPVLSLGVFFASGENLEEAMSALGMNAGEDVIHQFEPVGTSWVRFSEAGRVALHTWPEKGLVSVDVWCDEPIDLANRLAGLGWVQRDEGEQS